jgi:hypothetical protein
MARPLVVTNVLRPIAVPSGLETVTSLCEIVTPVIARLTGCPAVPSNRTKPTLLAVLIVAVRLAPPIAIRPVNSTSAALYGEGGMKKSAVLRAEPNGVLTPMRPEPATCGTDVIIEVLVEEETLERVLLNFTLLFMAVVWKLVPVIVTAVPAVPIFGVNPVIVGAPVEEVTVKTELLAAEPLGELTPIGPEVAPAGTVVTIFVVVDDVTEAVTPLNVTVFWLGVALNPVP